MPVVPAREAAQLIIDGRAPENTQTGVLQLSLAQTKKPIALPAGLRCYSLALNGQPLQKLPHGLQVEYKLDLTDCRRLDELPCNFRVSTLNLSNCAALTKLPEGLDVNFLQLDGCTSLRHWPESAQVSCGWVRARGCVALEKLPSRLGPLASLDLRGCRRLGELASGIQVRSFVDIGDTRITSLPDALSGVALRWRGVPVTAQIAFFPETLTGRDILSERNAEVRRVMIERMGFERFLSEVSGEVLDRDRDRGGERKLVRVNLADDEPIVVVSVHCPSTGRQYLVRVPPNTQTCHQAIAWTAGFDDPDDYSPLEET